MKISTVLFATAMLIAACAPASIPAPEPGTLPPDAPVTSPPGTDPTAMDSPEMPFAPKPDDANLSRGTVFIHESGLLIRESFPPQIALALSGELPTPCHELRVVVQKPDGENKIDVEAYSVVDPEQVCIQVLQSFAENIELGTFPGGHYTVWVNGEMVGEFDS
ncbi:MAG TPA: hypothetical protein VI524_10245 [Anaerolineales bacterium]|nr:hypothetical protein [Anaerolineales bacterium]